MMCPFAYKKLNKRFVDGLQNEICKKYGLESSHFGANLAKLTELAEQNIVHIENRNLAVNLNARQLVRIVCSAFDQYFSFSSPSTETKRHSAAV